MPRGQRAKKNEGGIEPPNFDHEAEVWQAIFLTEPFYLSRNDYRESTNADLYELYRLAVEKKKAMDKEMGGSNGEQATARTGDKVWVPQTDADNVFLMKMLGVQGIPDDLLKKSTL